MLLNPFRSRSYYYKKGKNEGYRDGYNEASSAGEIKFANQYNQFMKQIDLAKQQIDKYEKLLDEYDIEIDILMSKVERTEEENSRLIELLKKQRIIYKENEEVVKTTLAKTPEVLPVLSEGKLLWR